MTQHMLIQTANPTCSLDDIVFTPVGTDPDCVFARAAVVLFPDRSIPIWKLSPRGAEMDPLADQARNSILDGVGLRQTVLGALLHELVARGELFCLFWALDFADLPRPDSEADLFELLTEQLSSDRSWNWELYAWWGGSG